MHFLLAIALFGQQLVHPFQGYLLPSDSSPYALRLVMPEGRADVRTGFPCDWYGPWQNVEVYRISDVPDQFALVPIDENGGVVTTVVVPGGVEELFCGVELLQPIGGAACRVDDLGHCQFKLEDIAQ